MGKIFLKFNKKTEEPMDSSVVYRVQVNIPGYSTLANFEYNFEPDGPSTNTVK